MTPEPASPRGSDYAELSRQVRQAGLLDRRPGYYAWKIALTARRWCSAGQRSPRSATHGGSWRRGVPGGGLRPVRVPGPRCRAQAGLPLPAGQLRPWHRVGNLGIGLSYDWWVGKHNRHHAHPNTEGADPDIVGALAFTARRRERQGGPSD